MTAQTYHELLRLCSRITRAIALADEHHEYKQGVGDPARSRAERVIRKRLAEAHRDAKILLSHVGEALLGMPLD